MDASEVPFSETFLPSVPTVGEMSHVLMEKLSDSLENMFGDIPQSANGRTPAQWIEKQHADPVIRPVLDTLIHGVPLTSRNPKVRRLYGEKKWSHTQTWVFNNIQSSVNLPQCVPYRNFIHDPAVVYNIVFTKASKNPVRFISPNLPHLKTIVSWQNVFSCDKRSVISGRCWISSVLRNKVKTSMITSITNWRGHQTASGSWLTTLAGVFLIRYVSLYIMSLFRNFLIGQNAVNCLFLWKTVYMDN